MDYTCPISLKSAQQSMRFVYKSKALAKKNYLNIHAVLASNFHNEHVYLGVIKTN